MKAKIGDIYTIYNNRLRLYTACQIINVIEDKGDAICLYLDWTGESPLHPVQMEISNLFIWISCIGSGNYV